MFGLRYIDGMKTTFIFIFLFSFSTFAYDINCKASRYFGVKKFDLTISDINTDYGSRAGHLILKSSSLTIIERSVSVVKDYIDGHILSIETRDMSVNGYIEMDKGKGDLEVLNKSYTVSKCKYVQ